MNPGETQRNGAMASVARIGESLLALARSRVQMFAFDLQSEKLRLVDTLVWAGIALALGGGGFLVGIFALALYVWEAAGYAGLVALVGVLLAAASALLWDLQRRLKAGPIPFADTLAEFEKDAACIRGKD